MPKRYYVLGQQQKFPYGIKRLCGPFDTDRAAWLMQRPITRAIAGREGYEAITISVFTLSISKAKLKAGASFPKGAIDPSWIDLNDVIEASRKHNDR